MGTNVTSVTIFIDSSGNDTDVCGGVNSPCGTIAFATALSMYSETFSNISKVDLYVTGQNEEEIALWQHDNKLSSDISFLGQLRNEEFYFGNNEHSSCVFYDRFDKSVEVTFDPNEIQTMTDWFPDICAESWHWVFLWRRKQASMHPITIFNNLIINDLNMDELPVLVLLNFENKPSLQLNNCSFYNIYRTDFYQYHTSYDVNAVIYLSNASISNTSFHNIVMNPSSNTDDDILTFIQISTGLGEIDEISFYMQNCHIKDYTNSMGPFMVIDARNVFADTREVNIYNSIFWDINTTTALIVSSSFLKSWKITMHIISCNFSNINFGSILYTQNLHSVYIEDVFITTKQRVKDLTDLNEDHSLISLFVFGDDEVEMKNITLKYEYSMSNNCEEKHIDRYDVGLFVIIHTLYNCYAPIQFLQNEGIVNITDFIVLNDIDYDSMDGLYYCYFPSDICEFNYFASETDYSLLSNDGILVMNGFFIRGVGIGYQLVLNKGNAFIDNAMCQYSYYHDVFDPFTINNHILFRNDGRSVYGGVLKIHNSYLFGAQYVALQLNKGSTYITNTVIEQSQTALTATPDVVYLFVDNVQFINIGPFYTSYLRSVISTLNLPPLLISAHQSIIQNSYFSYFDRYGLIVVSPEIFLVIGSIELSLSEDSSYHISLINNTFEVNTEDTLLTVQQVQDIQTMFASQMDGLEDVQIVADKLEALRYNASAIFQFGCLICVFPRTSLHMIGNIFYGNTISSITPFLSINNAPNVNCISNNIIYGYAIYLISGTVTSCHRTQLVEFLPYTNFTCWNGSLGKLNDEYKYLSTINESDVFVVTEMENLPLILLESAESVFVAEKISFLSESDRDVKYNAIKIISGTLFMFDADLDESFDISYNDNCNVHCFTLLNSNVNTLLQINIECGNDSKHDGIEYNELSLFSDATASFKNYFSAHSIELRTSGTYYPGGTLDLNHSIHDIFGNKITGYDQRITIELSSSRLYLLRNISIDENGDCIDCKALYLENISIQDIGNSFPISVSIENNQLAVKEVTFTVSECPPGFGKVAAAKIKQCGLCDTFHFSFVPTSNECFSCSNVDSYSSGKGFNCEGEDSVTIGYNVWLSAVHDKAFISPLNITQNDTIYTSQCPPQQCCQSMSGCSFLHSKQLCAKNRDVNTPLCGQCIDGMYELSGTASCGNCSNMSSLYYTIPIFIATLLLVIGLLYDAKDIDPKKYMASEINYKKLVRNDEIHCLMIMISKVFLYYYQSLSQILYSKGIENTFSPILNVFDLSFSLGASSDGICIFPFITHPLIKMILNSIFIPFGFFHFIWLPFAIQCFKKRRQSNSTKYTFIYVASLKLFVISCGTLLTLSFKLLSCITFPSYMAHFYDPITPCFSGYWILGLVLFSFVVLAFILMAYKIYKQTVEQRNNHTNIFRKMISAYNESEWWWEFVLFSRRVIIALCTSIRNVNARDLDAILLTLLLIYLMHHTRKMPFKYNRLNFLEMICLAILVLIFAIFSDDITKQYTLFTEYFVALAILLPFIVMLYHIIRIFIFITSSSSSKSFSETELIQIQKAKKRAPIPILTNDSNLSANTDERVKTILSDSGREKNDIDNESEHATAGTVHHGIIHTRRNDHSISTIENSNSHHEDEMDVKDHEVNLSLAFEESVDIGIPKD